MKLKSLALPVLAAVFALAAAPAFAAPRQFKVQLKPGQSVEVTKADGTKETLSAPAGGAEKIVDIPLGATVKNTTPGEKYSSNTQVAVWSGNIKFELDGAEGLKVDSTASGDFKVAATGSPVDIRAGNKTIKIYDYNKDVTITTTEKGLGQATISPDGRGRPAENMGSAMEVPASIVEAFKAPVNNPLQETTVASPSAP